MKELLTREQFRQQVFELTDGICAFCEEKAIDAHHIIERHLWPDEGYYLENGIPVCEFHHRLAERNVITPTFCRQIMGYNLILPPQLDQQKYYDKWGNELKIPLRENARYPHTRYFSFSPSIQIDDEDEDEECFDLKQFLNCPLIFTTKMDGSNFRMTNEFVAARNGADAEHPSFDMAKAIHAEKRFLIEKNEQIFGEWLFAKHSIHYVKDLKLPGLFLIFGILKNNEFQDWQTIEQAEERLGFKTVPILAKNEIFDAEWKLQARIIELGEKAISQGHEGIVVRSAYSFHFSQFGLRAAKYVRKDHVQTNKHWRTQPIIKNEL